MEEGGEGEREGEIDNNLTLDRLSVHLTHRCHIIGHLQ